MPYPPIKSEQYQNIGGLNRKASPYMTGTNEVINILNFDYTVPGAYTVRPGTTAQLTGFTGPISSFTQFSRLNGLSYEIFSNQQYLYSYDGATSRIIGTFGVTLGFYVGSINPRLSFVSFVDRLFAGGINSNGNVVTDAATYSPFLKTNGVTSYFFSLPPPRYYDSTPYNASLNVIGITVNYQGVYFVPGAGGVGLSSNLNAYPVTGTSFIGFSGLYQYAFAWINERGYLGPIGFTGMIFTPIGVPGPAPRANNTSNVGVQVWGFTQTGPAFFGYSSFVFYFTSVPAAGYGITAIAVFRAGPIPLPNGETFPIDITQGLTFLSSMYDLAVIPLGSTSFTDFGATLGGGAVATGVTLYSQSLWFTTAPSYLELYNNSLFIAGFSASRSNVYFSAIGEPELIGATQSFEVRTDDADIITGVKNYISQLVLFKNRSFHSLTGNAPSNYSLREISAQYGCISNRATVVYNDTLLFLDRKGICQFDGANTEIISNRVEATFRRMNLAAAQQQALMLHVKDRNEIWTVFPIDGANFNNYMVIYDYVANAFSEWQGPQMASIGLAFDPNQFLTPFYGNYSGVIHYFGSTFFNDSGTAFTCTVEPRYFGGQNQELGYSVEKMFRRLYIDITDNFNPPALGVGQTNVFTVSLFSDFMGGTIMGSQMLYRSPISPQQQRLDFGIPGKAMTYSLTFVPKTAALNFNGYTIEYRYQRNV